MPKRNYASYLHLSIPQPLYYAAYTKGQMSGDTCNNRIIQTSLIKRTRLAITPAEAVITGTAAGATLVTATVITTIAVVSSSSSNGDALGVNVTLPDALESVSSSSDTQYASAITLPEVVSQDSGVSSTIVGSWSMYFDSTNNQYYLYSSRLNNSLEDFMTEADVQGADLDNLEVAWTGNFSEGFINGSDESQIVYSIPVGDQNFATHPFLNTSDDSNLTVGTASDDSIYADQSILRVLMKETMDEFSETADMIVSAALEDNTILSTEDVLVIVTSIIEGE
jgi:hypothetical protein